MYHNNYNKCICMALSFPLYIIIVTRGKLNWISPVNSMTIIKDIHNYIVKIGLKVAPESISEGLFFKNFLGGHAPRPPRSLHASHAGACFTCRTHPLLHITREQYHLLISFLTLLMASTHLNCFLHLCFMLYLDKYYLKVVFYHL